MIKAKIGRISRKWFFPDNPDRLFEKLNTKDEKEKEKVIFFAKEVFDCFKLMTSFERTVIAQFVFNSCPCGPPQNIHQTLEYLARNLEISSDELISIFSRLDCLSFRTRIEEAEHEDIEGLITGSRNIVKLTFNVFTKKYIGNATHVLIAIIECMSEHLCDSCFSKNLENVDFSVLSSLTSSDC